MDAKPACEFYETNGRHCVIMDDCIVCRTPQPPALAKGQEIGFKNFGNIDGTYRIVNIKDGRLQLEFLK